MGMGFPFGRSRAPTSAGRSILGRSSAGRGLAGAAPFFDPEPGDPNPARFEIVKLEEFGPYVVAEIIWPDAKNFDGRKVSVYRAGAEQLRSAKLLDPHFQETVGPLVPIARFEPTILGWALARHCAKKLHEAFP
jgi:hypothetical protein